ncbi:MAG: DUF211 domain-containing protein [Candidatus Nanohalobium sp.]
MANIRRLVLDVLKPHEPSITRFAQEISEMEEAEGVNATMLEIDEEVQNIKITVQGENLREEKIKELVEDLGGSIHSFDEIVCGEDIVEEVETPQDK